MCTRGDSQWNRAIKEVAEEHTQDFNWDAVKIVYQRNCWMDICHECAQKYIKSADERNECHNCEAYICEHCTNMCENCYIGYCSNCFGKIITGNCQICKFPGCDHCFLKAGDPFGGFICDYCHQE